MTGVQTCALPILAEKYALPAMVEAVRRGDGLDDNGNGTGGVEDLEATS